MTTLMRRAAPRPLDIFDWLEAPWAVLHPAGGHPVRLEDYVTDGNYMLRAELPGIDPAKDLEVSLTNGVLTMKAERHEESGTTNHSEFRYGTFVRSVTLPAEADEDHIEAIYDAGIVEITVPLVPKDAGQVSLTIPVLKNQHITPS